MSRQNMCKLMRAHAGGFPAPVHEGSASICRLAEALEWLEVRGGYQIEPSVLEIAQAALEVNMTKEARRFLPEVSRYLEPLIS